LPPAQKKLPPTTTSPFGRTARAFTPKNGLANVAPASADHAAPSHRGNPAAKLGDLDDTSFADLWARADTTVVDPRRDCRFHCARHTANVEIAALPGRPGPVELIDDFDPFI
jgi:hypothetical protein